MRTVKFRVWDQWVNKFIPPDEIKSLELFLTVSGEVYSQKFGTIYPKVDYDISQYTGLVDKNDKEIYEGDIVTASHEVHDSDAVNFKRIESYTGVIRYQHSYWAIGDYKLFVMDDESLEVIGNIFENPELLIKTEL